MRAFLAIAVLAACGGDDKVTIETKPIGETGFVVDAPKTWELEEIFDETWELEDDYGDGPQVSVDKFAPDQPGGALCEGQETTRGTMPGGGAWATCKGPAKQIRIEGAELITTKLDVIVPHGGGAIRCFYETTRHDRVPGYLAACKTIRKQ